MNKKHHKNLEGDKRNIGIEIEYAQVPLPKTSNIIQDLFGGEEVIESDLVYRVKDTSLGDFKIEVDAIPLQKLSDIIDDLDNKKDQNVSDQAWQEFLQKLENLGEEFTPLEVVCPPIPITDMSKLENFRDALRKAGALGTKGTVYNAFGLHLNPEVQSLEANYLCHHLQSYLLLHPWLVSEHKVDLARRLSGFIKPFPKSYAKHILRHDYTPTVKELIKDYHDHNPTRDRTLDMLPVFAHLQEEFVRELFGEKEKIKPRPTFHYRLPNCELGREDWTINSEWQRWLWVEKLAHDSDRREKLMSEWQNYQEKWFSLDKEWINIVTSVMEFEDA